jgi:hypothetical protein
MITNSPPSLPSPLEASGSEEPLARRGEGLVGSITSYCICISYSFALFVYHKNIFESRFQGWTNFLTNNYIDINLPYLIKISSLLMKYFSNKRGGEKKEG